MEENWPYMGWGVVGGGKGQRGGDKTKVSYWCYRFSKEQDSLIGTFWNGVPGVDGLPSNGFGDRTGQWLARLSWHSKVLSTPRKVWLSQTRRDFESLVDSKRVDQGFIHVLCQQYWGLQSRNTQLSEVLFRHGNLKYPEYWKEEPDVLLIFRWGDKAKVHYHIFILTQLPIPW